MLARFRPSPAMVVACVALAVALGGSAYAVTSLPDNSVGTKQLKDRAVTRKKIKDGALTGRKIAKRAISRRNLDIRALGTLPSADTATRALTAGNANAVGGQTVKKISWFVPASTAPRTLFNAVGLKITASCDSASHIIVNASGPATNNAELQAHIDADGTFVSLGDSTFNSGDSDSLTRDSTTEGSGVLAYATSDGHVATMDYGFDFSTSLPGVACGFWGEMIYS